MVDDLSLFVEPIELRENNPYSIGSIFVFEDQSLSLDPGSLNFQPSVNDRYYTVIQTDTIWNIAFEAYGDSKLWWIIAKVNNIELPFYLKPGISLIIPFYDNLKVTSL